MYLFYFLNLILIFLFLGAVFGTPWVPTRKKDFDRIANLAELKPGMIFYDLGSGDGSLSFYLSKKYKVKCVGIEISPILYLYSKLRSLFSNGIKIKYGDFFKYDISEADIIYCFLQPKMYKRLEKKIKEGAKKEAVIILAAWPFVNKQYTKASTQDKNISYYLYKNKRIA